MQIEVVLTQRFAVVGQVQHGGVDFVLTAAQQVDQRGQHVVGVTQGVVVAIDDCLLIALVQGVAVAHRGESLERLRITLVVIRAVATHLVQDQHGVLVEAVEQLGQALQEDFVVALAAGTQGGSLRLLTSTNCTRSQVPLQPD